MDERTQQRVSDWKAKLEQLREQFEKQINYDRSYWIGWLLCHGPAMLETIEALYAKPVEHLSCEHRAMRAVISARVRGGQSTSAAWLNSNKLEECITEQLREALYCASATHLCPYCKQDFPACDPERVRRHERECQLHPLHRREHHLSESLFFIARLKKMLEGAQLYDADRAQLKKEFDCFALWVASNVDTCCPIPE